jgi:hypothetical protein
MPQQKIKIEYVDQPNVREAFADSMHTCVFDGETLRLEFNVTRYGETREDFPPTTAQKYPVCRLALSKKAALELINRIETLTANLKKIGALTPRPGQKAQRPVQKH